VLLIAQKSTKYKKTNDWEKKYAECGNIFADGAL
jgi:hypothetical protein